MNANNLASSLIAPHFLFVAAMAMVTYTADMRMDASPIAYRVGRPTAASPIAAKIIPKITHTDGQLIGVSLVSRDSTPRSYPYRTKATESLRLNSSRDLKASALIPLSARAHPKEDPFLA